MQHPIPRLAAVAPLLVVLTIAALLAPPSGAEPAAGPDAITTIEIGRSVNDKPIKALVLGKGPETVMVLASIHGSEPAGTPFIDPMLAHIRKHPQLLTNRRIVIVPIVNPDGYERRRRTNVHGVDLNRNFPAANRTNNKRTGRKGLSEPESRAIHALIWKHKPNRIVSIHQPVGCIDYDGPAGKLAAAMAKACDLPVRRLGSQPGSLGSYAAVDLGIPTITLELRKGDESLGPDVLWKKYGAAMLAFIEFREE